MASIDIAAIARTQDFTTIKQFEDNRAALAQMNMNQQSGKEIQNRAKQVVHTEETQWQQKRFDAKEKSDNEYAGDGGKKRKNKPVDQVVVKRQQGFDVKI